MTRWNPETNVTTISYKIATGGVYVPIKPRIFSSKKVVCNDELAIYSIPNLPPNIEIEWLPGPNMNLISGQGTVNAHFKPLKSGYVTVKAIIRGEGVQYSGNTLNIENSDVWVGKPETPTQIQGFDMRQFNPDTTYPFLVGHNSSIETFNWTITGNASKYVLHVPTQYNNNMMVTMGPKGRGSSFTISVTAQNRCGISASYSRTGTIQTNTGGPIGGITDGVTNGLKSTTTVDTPSPPVTIKVYNFTTGSIVHQEKNAIDFNIQNTSLKEGIYIIETTDKNGDKTTEKVYKKNQ